MIKECPICHKEISIPYFYKGVNQKTCSKRCFKIWRKKYMNNYWKNNPKKADINRNRARNRKVRILKELKEHHILKVFDMNLRQINSICEECYEEFYYNFKIFKSKNITLRETCESSNLSDTIDGYMESSCNSLYEYSTLKINSTPWGASVCPKCGLVAKHVYDNNETYKDYNKYSIYTKEDYDDLYVTLNHIDKYPIIKRTALYLDNFRIDFLSEARDIRRKVCYINKNKSELTEEEEQICIRAMLKETKKIVKENT